MHARIGQTLKLGKGRKDTAQDEERKGRFPRRVRTGLPDPEIILHRGLGLLPQFTHTHVPSNQTRHHPTDHHQRRQLPLRSPPLPPRLPQRNILRTSPPEKTIHHSTPPHWSPPHRPRIPTPLLQRPPPQGGRAVPVQGAGERRCA